MKNVLTGAASAMLILAPGLAWAGDDQGSITTGVHIALMALCAVPVVYFVPSVIAATQDHPNAGGVFLVNLLLGWTVAGWVVALVWALGKSRSNLAALARPLIAATPRFAPELAAKEIEDLVALRDKAVISEAEYATLKQRILDKWAQTLASAAPVKA